MPVTIDSLFGLQQMGESVGIFQDIPMAQRLQGLFKPEPCYADVYRFDREDFEISFAPFVGGRTSPAIETKMRDKQVEFISLAHIRLGKTLHAANLFTQRHPGEISDNAAAEVAKVRQQQRNKVRLAVERLCAMALRGTITINATNFPGSETSISIARAVTALTATASWALAATEIIGSDGEIQGWRDDMEQIAGLPLDHLLFNRKVLTYILHNTQCKEWIARTQKGVDVFSSAQFESAGGIGRWETYDGFYKPEGGSATKFISDDEVFALPPAQYVGEICRLIEGHGEIPVNAIGGPGAAGGIVGAVRASSPGIFEFAMPLTGDVPGIQLFTGWYGIPLIKVPTAIGYCADVTP